MIRFLIVAAALGYLAWQARAMALAFASLQWRPARGTVQECFVGESALSGDDDRQDGYHSANIRYTYRVGTRQFVSTRLSYRPTRGLMFGEAIEQLHGLHAGREIEVFYDPRQPARAVLVPGPSHDNAMHTAMAAVLFAFALWAAL